MGWGDFDKTMEQGGGVNNAYTSNDLTVYQDWFPAPLLETIFDLEADRVANLAFDPKVIASERQVVYSERRLSVDNNNEGHAERADGGVRHLRRPLTTGRWWVGRADIEGWTMEDLKAYFAMGYSPSNATMVVVGGVKAAEVFRLAEKYMEPIVGAYAAAAGADEGAGSSWASGGCRWISLRSCRCWTWAITRWMRGRRTSYVFQLIDNLLTTGQSSRLYQSLVDKQQLAVSVNTSICDRRSIPACSSLRRSRAKGVTAEAVEKAIDDRDRASWQRKGRGTAKELQKAKNQAIAALLSRAAVDQWAGSAR